MEALGSPSISLAPTSRVHAFRIPKSSVCQWQVQQQYTIVCLPEIYYTASGFFLKIFNHLCLFVFVTFWSCFFFLFLFLQTYTLWKTEKKQQQKNNNILQTGQTNTLLCRSFIRLSGEKRKVYVLSKNLHQSLPYAQIESYLACK